MTPSPTRVRRPSVQLTLQVVATTWLSPGLVRVSLGGEQVSLIPERPETDQYSKLFFPPAGSTLQPPYDLAVLRDEVPFEQLPTVRTYTIRRVDRERQIVDIDFVVHGDTGVAGPWAAAAKPGDSLTMSSPGAGYSPDLSADHRILIGDESAIPAIAAALESLPAGTSATVLLEARSPQHRIGMPEAGTVTWIDEDHDQPGKNLVAAVEALEWPSGRVQVFAHGERGAMKSLRPILTARGVERSDLSLSAYWALGRTEDAFQSEKRTPAGKIFED